MLLKYNSVGSLIWQRTWGGSASDNGNGVVVDTFGNVYVVGGTSSFGAGWYDALILKFDSSGNLIWQRTWGGSSFDVAYDIAFDSSGDLYVAAESYSLGDCAVVLKLDANGNHIATYTWKGSATYDSGYSVDVDTSGNIILSGTSWDYSVSPYHISILLVKFNNQGTFLWHRNIVSGAQDYSGGAKTVRFDSSQNIVVAGYRAAVCPTSNFSTCNFDAEVNKLDPNGSLLWSFAWGGSGYDSLGGLSFDGNGNLIVSGATNSFFSGTNAALLLKLDPNGNLLQSLAWGGNGAASGAGLAVDASGEVVIGGSAPNAGDTWQNVTGSGNSLSPAITSPVGITGMANYTFGSPTGTVTKPIGVGDTGGGAADALVIKLPVPSLAGH